VSDETAIDLIGPQRATPASVARVHAEGRRAANDVATKEDKPKRKKSSNSPTKRSLAKLRDAGYHVEIVERWNPFARIRQDLLGFADLLALREGQILAVQVTAAGVSARLEKIRNEPRARLWLSAGGSLEVHGWRLVGKRGERKTYQARVVRVWMDGDAMMTDED